jgi:hypothetical protein
MLAVKIIPEISLIHGRLYVRPATVFARKPCGRSNMLGRIAA